MTLPVRRVPEPYTIIRFSSSKSLKRRKMSWRRRRTEQEVVNFTDFMFLIYGWFFSRPVACLSSFDTEKDGVAREGTWILLKLSIEVLKNVGVREIALFEVGFWNGREFLRYRAEQVGLGYGRMFITGNGSLNSVTYLQIWTHTRDATTFWGGSPHRPLDRTGH